MSHIHRFICVAPVSNAGTPCEARVNGVRAEGAKPRLNNSPTLLRNATYGDEVPW
jgi:hypothetical protein